MSSLTERYAERGPFRRVSALLLAVSVVLPLALDLSDSPTWLWVAAGFTLFLPAYILLCVFTYGRLRNAWLAGGWVALMIVVTHVGPGWHASPRIEFRVGDALGLIPLLLAWFAPAKSGGNSPFA